MPYCPRCRDEWQDWVKVCPDCHVDLVDKLPVGPEPDTTNQALDPYFFNKRPAKYEKLVTVATYTYAVEAYLALAKLKSEGILCFAADDYVATIVWPCSSKMGGVRIQVRECDAEEARRVLDLPQQNMQADIDE